MNFKQDRSFALQVLAFRGEHVEPPRACGVSIILLFRRSQAPSAPLHSAFFIKVRMQEERISQTIPSLQTIHKKRE
ncbi:hypothetical protein KV679_19075 [Bacillus sp. JRC01]|nr:hypothetical protein [Bacillus sp. JRC01]